MSALSIILDIVAIALFARPELQAFMYLILQCIKTVFWKFALILDIVAAIRSEDVGLTFLCSTIEFGSSRGRLIYGFIVFHKKATDIILGRGGYKGVGAGMADYQSYDDAPRGS